jgi:hypothetical protein
MQRGESKGRKSSDCDDDDAEGLAGTRCFPGGAWNFEASESRAGAQYEGKLGEGRCEMKWPAWSSNRLFEGHVSALQGSGISSSAWQGGLGRPASEPVDSVFVHIEGRSAIL